LKKILVILLFPIISFSQETVKYEVKSLEEHHKTLQDISDKLYQAKSDSEKNALNTDLINEFERALNQPNSFDFGFDSLKKDISILTSEDNKVKLYTWEIKKDDNTYQYHGFIQYKLSKKSKKESVLLFQLIDKSNEIKNQENYAGDHKKWIGMWYYKMITKKYKSKTYYTLLAWDGNDAFTQKKIIDVLTFDEKGNPRFGADIFTYQKRFPKRIIFEYSATCNMSLKYSPSKDSIIFGHLAPTNPLLVGQFQYYCSDLSFDGFGFKKGNWNYKADVKAINEKDKNDSFYRKPSKDDKDVKTNYSENYLERKKKLKKQKKQKK